jgi:hypothetical protein
MKTDMKRIVLLAVLAFAIMTDLAAWGPLGHEVVIAVAQRHLTEQTKKNIAEFIPYDLKEDAVWMDIHRNDEDIAYTNSWHTSYFDKDFNYNPNVARKLPTGDVFRAMTLIEATFRNSGYKRHDAQTVILYLRALIHFVGDMHCPVHTYFEGKNAKWGTCALNGVEYMNFHVVYDLMPSLVWGRDMPADDVAAKIDDASKKEIRKVQSGTLYDWLSDAARRNVVIYAWNPGEPSELNPDTTTLSADLVNRQMRDAGYRLAFLLNLYFGE